MRPIPKLTPMGLGFLTPMGEGTSPAREARSLVFTKLTLL